MDMDQSAVWLAGSVLVMMGFVVVVAGLIVINNLLHRYWKPVRIFTADSWHFNPPVRYATDEELEKINQAKENKK
jgi:hypothetical protein